MPYNPNPPTLTTDEFRKVLRARAESDKFLSKLAVNQHASDQTLKELGIANANVASEGARRANVATQIANIDSRILENKAQHSMSTALRVGEWQRLHRLQASQKAALTESNTRALSADRHATASNEAYATAARKSVLSAELSAHRTNVANARTAITRRHAETTPVTVTIGRVFNKTSDGGLMSHAKGYYENRNQQLNLKRLMPLNDQLREQYALLGIPPVEGGDKWNVNTNNKIQVGNWSAEHSHWQVSDGGGPVMCANDRFSSFNYQLDQQDIPIPDPNAATIYPDNLAWRMRDEFGHIPSYIDVSDVQKTQLEWNSIDRFRSTAESEERARQRSAAASQAATTKARDLGTAAQDSTARIARLTSEIDEYATKITNATAEQGVAIGQYEEIGKKIEQLQTDRNNLGVNKDELAKDKINLVNERIAAEKESISVENAFIETLKQNAASYKEMFDIGANLRTELAKQGEQRTNDLKQIEELKKDLEMMRNQQYSDRKISEGLSNSLTESYGMTMKIMQERDELERRIEGTQSVTNQQKEVIKVLLPQQRKQMDELHEKAKEAESTTKQSEVMYESLRMTGEEVHAQRQINARLEGALTRTSEALQSEYLTMHNNVAELQNLETDLEDIKSNNRNLLRQMGVARGIATDERENALRADRAIAAQMVEQTQASVTRNVDSLVAKESMRQIDLASVTNPEELLANTVSGISIPERPERMGVDFAHIGEVANAQRRIQRKNIGQPGFNSGDAWARKVYANTSLSDNEKAINFRNEQLAAAAKQRRDDHLRKMEEGWHAGTTNLHGDVAHSDGDLLMRARSVFGADFNPEKYQMPSRSLDHFSRTSRRLPPKEKVPNLGTSAPVAMPQIDLLRGRLRNTSSSIIGR